MATQARCSNGLLDGTSRPSPSSEEGEVVAAVVEYRASQFRRARVNVEAAVVEEAVSVCHRTLLAP